MGPDEFRLWPADGHSPGRAQGAYDKQAPRGEAGTGHEWQHGAQGAYDKQALRGRAMLCSMCRHLGAGGVRQAGAARPALGERAQGAVRGRARGRPRSDAPGHPRRGDLHDDRQVRGRVRAPDRPRALTGRARLPGSGTPPSACRRGAPRARRASDSNREPPALTSPAAVAPPRRPWPLPGGRGPSPAAVAPPRRPWPLPGGRGPSPADAAPLPPA